MSAARCMTGCTAFDMLAPAAYPCSHSSQMWIDWESNMSKIIHAMLHHAVHCLRNAGTCSASVYKCWNPHQGEHIGRVMILMAH